MHNQGFELREARNLERKESQKRKERLYKTDFFNRNKTPVEGEDNEGLVLSPEHSTTDLSALENQNIKEMESVGCPGVYDSSEWVNVPNVGVRHPRDKLLVALNNYNNNVVNVRRLYFQQAMNQIEEMVNSVLDGIELIDNTWTFRRMSPSCFYEIKAHNEIDVFLVLKGLTPSDLIIEEVLEPIGCAKVKMITSSSPEEVEPLDDGDDVIAPVSLVHAMTSSSAPGMTYPMMTSITSLKMSPEESTPISSTVTSRATSVPVTSRAAPVVSPTTSRMTSLDAIQQGDFAKYIAIGEDGDSYLSAKKICKTFASLVNQVLTHVQMSSPENSPSSNLGNLLSAIEHEDEQRDEHNRKTQDVEAGRKGKKVKKKVSFKKADKAASNIVPDPVEFPTVTTPYVVNLIPTLECPQLWPKCASWLKTCARKWPNKELKQKIVSQGVHLAALPTGKDRDLWQIKFLNGRRNLIHHEGNESKATCLRILKVMCENDLSYPKAIIPSFLENILMWASRKYWSGSDWTDTNVPARFLELLAGLHKCVKNHDCHDFFLPSLNLFSDLEDADLEILSNKVMDMLADPFKYLEH